MESVFNKKCFFTCCLLFVFSFFNVSGAMGYEQEVQRLSASMAKLITKNKTVAVVDFTDLNGQITDYGKFLAEAFSVALAKNANDFKVVDRNHLKKIIDEHKLASSGIVNPEDAKKIGKFAGVDILITGTIVLFKDHIKILIKGIDTETAGLVISDNGMILKENLGEISGYPLSEPSETVIKFETPNKVFSLQIVSVDLLDKNKLSISSIIKYQNFHRNVGDIARMLLESSYCVDQFGNRMNLIDKNGIKSDAWSDYLLKVPFKLQFIFEKSKANFKTINLVTSFKVYDPGAEWLPKSFRAIINDIPYPYRYKEE